jgi:hypothetical protein
MVKLVAMFNLPPGTDEAEFEKFFVNKHARKDVTNDLMPRVIDFTPVFVKDLEIKLPAPPKKAKKAGKEKGGKKR